MHRKTPSALGTFSPRVFLAFLFIDRHSAGDIHRAEIEASAQRIKLLRPARLHFGQFGLVLS
jgi:hypothetical protein